MAGSPQDTQEEASPPGGAVSLGAIPPSVVEAAYTARNLPLAQRLVAVTDPLLGAPYVQDPMGEGAGYDADPFARYDAFDCLTFVEEALALSLAGDAVHSAEVRDGLRYGGASPSYASRDHFMELQWLPDAVRQGWIRETTSEYGQTQTQVAQVSAATWKWWGRRSLFHLTDDELPVGTMELRVLPLSDAIEAVDRIRPGTILFSVREARPGVPIWITHTGIVIDGEEPTLRHAARFKSGARVRDQGLRWYLEHTAEYSNWRTAGVALFEPVEFGPRISRLPPATQEDPSPAP